MKDWQQIVVDKLVEAQNLPRDYGSDGFDHSTTPRRMLMDFFGQVIARIGEDFPDELTSEWFKTNSNTIEKCLAQDNPLESDDIETFYRKINSPKSKTRNFLIIRGAMMRAAVSVYLESLK